MTLAEIFGLDGRTAVVTGGARGIGAGIAEVLVEAGATVIIADVDLAGAEARAAALGPRAAAMCIDLADEASITRGYAGIVQRFGAPWLLVNNAALLDRELLLEGTAAHWDRILAVNARAPYLMSREAARAMVEAGEGGRIVHVASAAVIGAITQGHAAYASAKTALLGLARASALELAPHGVTVNLVLPGGAATPGAIAAKGPAPEGPARRPPALGMTEPRDVGAAVLYFASALAARVTNQVLAVDGGWSIT